MTAAVHREDVAPARAAPVRMPGLFGPLNPPFADYRGRRVWVIGASYGIGAAIARDLLARGAQVTLSARKRDLLRSVAGKNRDALIAPLDVTDVASVHAAAGLIEQAWGGFDLALVVAGTHARCARTLEKDLKRSEKDIESIRKQFADFMVASEEHLSIEVLKAETPLRIATSSNSFVIDGWIPTSRVDEIQTALDSLCCGLAFVEKIPPENEDEPPVKLKNPKPLKPFEFFISLVSTPKYEEIDPTLILFITFPLFFGFMVGDLGFGAGLIVLGAVIRLKLKGYPDLLKLGTIIRGSFVYGGDMKPMPKYVKAASDAA